MFSTEKRYTVLCGDSGASDMKTFLLYVTYRLISESGLHTSHYGAALTIALSSPSEWANAINKISKDLALDHEVEKIAITNISCVSWGN